METKEKIYNSATKIVFIIMALALVVLTFARIVDAKDFIVLASMAFAFYFTKSGVKTGNFGAAPQTIEAARFETPEEQKGAIVAEDEFVAGDDMKIDPLK